MIFVKTKLKKLPKNCKQCKLSIIEHYNFNPADSVRLCTVKGFKACPTEKSKNGNEKYAKPKWCPLIEMEDESKLPF